MVASALLSAIHVLTLALGLRALGARGRALAQPLDDPGWKQLLAADNQWGIAALLWITSGMARVNFGGKDPSFYFRNGFFWIKMSLFVLVLLLEIRPMITFIRARIARGRKMPPPVFPVATFRRINHAEAMLVVVIVFIAAFMARGAWLF